jgi:putative Mg2+ transporter-C (MgtC) family protein
VCRPGDVSSARDLLFEELERRQYPIQDIETLSEGEELVELAAALVPSAADPAELDLVIEELARHTVVVSATWTVSTTT